MEKRWVWVMAAMLGLCACGGDDDDAASGAGTGGATAGAAGSLTAGMGGTGTAGMGTAGTGVADPNGCGAADMTMDGPALHAAALAALASPMSNCGSSPSCHQGTGKAKLTLMGQTDLRTLMVGKMSCQVPTIPIVADGGGDAALNNSWLWLKLTHPLDSQNNLMKVDAWGTPGSCNQTTVGTFGFRMPWGLSGSTWPDTPKIRDWICKGAPGP